MYIYSHFAVYCHCVLLLLVFIFSILCAKTSCYIHKSNDSVRLDHAALLTKRQNFILTTHPSAFKQLMIGNKCPLRPSYRSDGWKNDVWGTPYLHNRPQHMSVMHKSHDKSWERGLIATHPQTKKHVLHCVRNSALPFCSSHKSFQVVQSNESRVDFSSVADRVHAGVLEQAV